MKDCAPGHPEASDIHDIHCPPSSPQQPRCLPVALSLELTLNLEQREDQHSVHL